MGVFATRSIDGVAWDRPVRLLRSEEIEHRTQDHPIGLRAHAHWMISSIFIWDQSTRWVAQHRCDNCFRANQTRSQFLMRDPAIASAMRALEQKGPRLRQLSTRGSTTSDLAWDTAQWRDVAVQPFKYSCADMVVRHLCLLTFLGLPVVAVLTHYEIFRPKWVRSVVRWHR